LLTETFAPGTNLRVAKTQFRVRETHVEEPDASPGQFVTLSPILLQDPDSHRSLVHDSDDYQAHLQQAINAQIHNHLDEPGSVSLMHLIPQAVRKRTIDEGTYLAQKAKLNLNEKTDHLKFLVNHGIGSSPALGFGMVVRDRNKPGPSPPGE
jgi:CRISPR-associated endoribonuclease Cas6